MTEAKTGDDDLDRALDIGIRIMSGEAPSQVVADVLGSTLDHDPPMITATCALKGRERDFLRSINVTQQQIDDWFRAEIADLRRQGLQALRDRQAAAQHETGTGLNMVPATSARNV